MEILQESVMLNMAQVLLPYLGELSMTSLFRLAVLTIGAAAVLVPVVQAVEPEAVNKAIDRGVVCLKQLQNDNGTWPMHPPNEIGSTALASLTLLECGVAPNDPSVQKAAQAIRLASTNCTHTYSISLSILFFDRLGEPADVPLIESLAVRLLAGQNGSGGWSYKCPPLAECEINRLMTIITNRPVAKSDTQPGAGPVRRALSKEIQAQLAIISKQVPNVSQRGTGDNSNTQFATLALWVARRYGMPAEQAFSRIEARFRGSQGDDGGWGYGNFPNAAALFMRQDRSSAAMTCGFARNGCQPGDCTGRHCSKKS